MKKLFLCALLLLCALILSCCTKSSDDTTSYVSAPSAESSQEVDETQASVPNSAKVIKQLSIDDFVNGEKFEYADLSFGSTRMAVLSELGVSESDILSSSSQDDMYIDTVVYEFDGIYFYPYVHFWNDGVMFVYLCADPSFYTEDVVKNALYTAFSAEFGDPDQDSDTIFWEKGDTRLWIGQTVSFPGHADCSAILIQKVTA